MRKIKQKIITTKSKIRVENHLIYKGIIIHNRKGFFRKDNTYVLFNKNSIILLTRNNEKLICTRIFGTLVDELRNKKLMKILTINSISI
jgi:large subunit ribosomal protein L14